MRLPIAVLALCAIGLSAKVEAQESTAPESSGPEPAKAPEPPDTPTARRKTNHEQFVGDLAVGFMGLSQIAVADSNGAFQNVSVPVVGGRYWLREGLGIDAGLGLLLASESTAVEVGDVNTETDVSRPSAFVLHGGVPLVLADSRYFCFQVVPEMNLGFAKTSQDVAGQDVDLTGFHFDMGGRVGGELHFGFVGLPQISLQAGVGMRLALERVAANNSETDDGASRSRRTLQTFAGNDPWDLFSGSVSALLYLDR